MQEDPTRIIRFPELNHIIGLSRSTIFRMERDGKFPRHIKLGANSAGWLLHEIEGWIKSRMEAK